MVLLSIWRLLPAVLLLGSALVAIAVPTPGPSEVLQRFPTTVYFVVEQSGKPLLRKQLDLPWPSTSNMAVGLQIGSKLGGYYAMNIRDGTIGVKYSAPLRDSHALPIGGINQAFSQKEVQDIWEGFLEGKHFTSKSDFLQKAKSLLLVQELNWQQDRTQEVFLEAMLNKVETMEKQEVVIKSSS
ncbi:hypothetical protein FB446DRAFT_738465 [Lentinula raphanica]|nr:hypothetical protein FB446DRAFT_738465 [Lentinula raphanica]